MKNESLTKYLILLKMEELPSEILLKIFGYLHQKLLYRLVCQKWKDVIDKYVVRDIFTRCNLCLDTVQEIISLKLPYKIRIINSNVAFQLVKNNPGCVHTLVVQDSNLKEAPSELATIHTLDLSRSKNLANIDFLSHIHTLDLSDCPLIQDISSLHFVHSLSLNYCNGIREVSNLLNLEELNLRHCDEVRRVSELPNLKWLDLTFCQRLIVVKNLEKLETLILADCGSLPPVMTGLKSVKCLDVACCNNAKICCLGNVQNLNLSWCQNITNVSMFKNMKILNLTGCDKVEDVSMLGNVYKLNLTNCERITDVSTLHSVPYLNLCGCLDDSLTACRSSDITDLSSLVNVKELKLSYKYNLKVDMLTDVNIKYYKYVRYNKWVPCDDGYIKYCQQKNGVTQSEMIHDIIPSLTIFLIFCMISIIIDLNNLSQ